MGHIKREDIVGAYIGPQHEMVGYGCLSNDEWSSLEADDIITEDDLDEDGFYFCDRCKKPLVNCDEASRKNQM